MSSPSRSTCRPPETSEDREFTHPGASLLIADGVNSWHVRVRSDGIIDANDTYNTLPFDFESAPAQVRISKDGPTVTLYRDAELVFVLTPAPADGNLTRFGFLSADGTGRVWMDNLLISPQALGMTGMILR